MKDMLLPSMSMAVIRQGGRGAGDPPLTIPNREVKPRSADGTGKPGEQGAAPVEGKASEGHLRGLLFFLRPREACPLPPFVFAHRRLPFGAVPLLPASFRFIPCLPGGCEAARGSVPPAADRDCSVAGRAQGSARHARCRYGATINLNLKPLLNPSVFTVEKLSCSNVFCALGRGDILMLSL